ncbi:hypothetical protein ACFWVB_20260 [Streptomyces microflavus]|uniref:hypothetical protein n=1 Tax=Streptomyces microflavus TaxID=1919 RepID=UPI0036487963
MTDVTEKGVSPVRERMLAHGDWLLGTVPPPTRPLAWTDWETRGTTWLKPGTLFGAVVIRAALVHAALDRDSPVACATALDIRLGGGPVFYTDDAFQREGSYTVLVPSYAAREWRVGGSLAHPHRALLEVPAPGIVKPERALPWWVVPLEGPADLCSPEEVATMVIQGRALLAGSGGEDEEQGGRDDA